MPTSKISSFNIETHFIEHRYINISMKRIIFIAACGLIACAGAFAQEEEPKLVVKPTGRILMDGGVMHSTDKTLDAQLNDGVAVPDVRVGVSATYGKWKAKVDVGFARQSL